MTNGTKLPDVVSDLDSLDIPLVPDLDDDQTVDNGDDNGDETVEPESTEDAAAATPRDRRRLVRRVLAAAAGVVCLGALVAAGVLGWALKQRVDIAHAGQEALATARTYTVALSSVDSTNIDQNFAQVIDGATGKFKDMYTQSSVQLRQLLIDNKASSKGTVVDSAIKSATKDEVDVLLFVDQSVSNTVNPGPRIDRMRIDMTMEKVNGRWLASKVDLS